MSAGEPSNAFGEKALPRSFEEFGPVPCEVLRVGLVEETLLVESDRPAMPGNLLSTGHAGAAFTEGPKTQKTTIAP